MYTLSTLKTKRVGSDLMATLTIRNVDPEVRQRLRMRAAQHGRSMEAELRRIITDAVGLAAEASADESGLSLAEAIRRRFASFGDVELEPHPPTPVRSPPKFC
jgi:antitoxin FitA